jgi:magnesium transporter
MPFYMGEKDIKAVINCAAYSNGQKIANLLVDDINAVLKQTDKFIWIGLHEPDKEMLTKIQREFDLHDLAIEDALRAHQRPKIESYGDTIFIVMRTTQMNGGKFDIGETHFFLGSNFIITVRHGSSVAYTDVRARCESTPHLLKKGPGFALYAVMDAIVDQYFPVVSSLEEKLDELEEQIFDEKFKRQTTAEIYQLKRHLLEVKRSVSPLIDICNKLMRFDLKTIDEETKPYFRDVYDHTLRINEMVDNARELLATALEANLSLISISQNEVSKRFAGWAAIIGIPTMVAGVYGMNFKFMPELEWRFGYPVILAFTVGLCAFLYLHFKRSGWL